MNYKKFIFSFVGLLIVVLLSVFLFDYYKNNDMTQNDNNFFELSADEKKALDLVQERINAEPSSVKKYAITEVQRNPSNPAEIFVSFSVSWPSSPDEDRTLGGYGVVDSSSWTIKEFIDPVPDEGWGQVN